jgi:prephenate dehydratase
MQVCIIGGRGRMGSWFVRLFEKDNIPLSVLGRANYSTLAESVKNADVILISTPVDAAAKIIQDIVPLVKTHQAVIDLSSIMTMNEKALSALPCGAMFLHGLFAPSMTDTSKAKFITATLRQNTAVKGFIDWLAKKGATIKESTVEKHDMMMAHVQALAHVNGILLAKTLADADITQRDIDDFSTVFFRLEFDAISRIFSQSPEMYANMQFHNKVFEAVLDKYRQNLHEIIDIIEKRDHARYEALFRHVTDSLKDILSHGFDESQEFVKTLSATMTKMAVLGPPATFTEIAANMFDPGAKKIFFESVGAVLKTVADGMVDCGVVPVENSIGGTVFDSIDGIYSRGLYITRMIVLPIKHCIAALSTKVQPDIVLSHPQALAQCADYLDKHYKNAKRVSTLSTSDAFRRIAEDYLVNAVAIGPKIAAEKYGLKIIDYPVQDSENNQTKFALISKKQSDSGRITSIVIAPHADRSGLLFDTLKYFKDSKINLTKLESRPSRQKLGTYIFHIDFEGSWNDPNIKKAMEGIMKENKVSWLGTYDVVVADDKKD